MDFETWIGFIALFTVIIFMVVVLIMMKKPYRQMKYLVIKKSLDAENRKLITDKEDLELLELLLEKFEWYAKNWWVNLTPKYAKRWSKAKKIFEKYNLDIDVVRYEEKEN